MGDLQSATAIVPLFALEQAGVFIHAFAGDLAILMVGVKCAARWQGREAVSLVHA